MRRILFSLTVVLAAAQPAPASAAPVVENVIAADFPVAIVWAPDGTMYFTERGGRVMALAPGAAAPQEVLRIMVTTTGETGLLGLEIDPDFPRSPLLYVFYTDSGGRNRVGRTRVKGGVGSPPEVILSGLASDAYHNGGILEFHPDGNLFVSTGEAHERRRAQNPNDIGGKILRMRRDGSAPSDNPLGDSLVYALGIRNAFGLAVDPVTGDLWETENGPDKNDEVNRILPGRNYGWPAEQCTGQQFEPAEYCFERVIAITDAEFIPIEPPAGKAWIDPSVAGNLFAGSFQGSIRRFGLSELRDAIVSHEVYLEEPQGAVGVFYGPDGNLYWTAPGSIKRAVLTMDAPSPSPSLSTKPNATVAGAPTPSPSAETGPAARIVVVAGGILLLGLVGLVLLRARLSR